MLPTLSLAYQLSETRKSDRILRLRDALKFLPEYRIRVIEITASGLEAAKDELTPALFRDSDYVLLVLNETTKNKRGLGALLFARTARKPLFLGESDFVSRIVLPIFKYLAKLVETDADEVEPFYSSTAEGYTTDIPPMLEEARERQIEFIQNRLEPRYKGDFLGTMLLLDEITQPGYDHNPQMSGSLLVFQNGLPTRSPGDYIRHLNSGMILVASLVLEQIADRGPEQIVLRATQYRLEEDDRDGFFYWNSSLAQEWLDLAGRLKTIRNTRPDESWRPTVSEREVVSSVMESVADYRADLREVLEDLDAEWLAQHARQREYQERVGEKEGLFEAAKKYGTVVATLLPAAAAVVYLLFGDEALAEYMLA